MSLLKEHGNIEDKEESPRVGYIEGQYTTAIDFGRETQASAFRKIEAIKSLSKREIAHIKKHIKDKLKLIKRPKIPRMRKIPVEKLVRRQRIVRRGKRIIIYRRLGRFVKKPR